MTGNMIGLISALGGGFIGLIGIYLTYKGKQSDNSKEMSKMNYDQLLQLYQEQKERYDKLENKVLAMEDYRAKCDEIRGKYDNLLLENEKLKLEIADLQKEMDQLKNGGKNESNH